MDFWINFWTGLLIVGVGLFACLAVVVTIGGARDVKALFQSIEAKHAQAKQNGSPDDIADASVPSPRQGEN